MSDSIEKHFGVYRGIVVDNQGEKGLIKIFVYGIYPEIYKDQPQALPWAEPCLSINAGNYTSVEQQQSSEYNRLDQEASSLEATANNIQDKNSNEYSQAQNNAENKRTEANNIKRKNLNQETGETTIPHKGAHLFLFFEQGCILKPVYFGACQGGDGWFSEHVNQHVIQTENVTVVVDETPLSGTNKFDSNNSNCTPQSQKNVKTDMPTRVNVQISCITGCALNIAVSGDVNIKVSGDIYEEIIGDKHETLSGNHYYKHVGDLHYMHDGGTHKLDTGPISEILGTLSKKNSYTTRYLMDRGEIFNYNKNKIVYGNQVDTISGSFQENVGKEKTLNVDSIYKVDVEGNYDLRIGGDSKEVYVGTVKLTFCEDREIRVDLDNLLEVGVTNKLSTFIDEIYVQSDAQAEYIGGKTISSPLFVNIESTAINLNTYAGPVVQKGIE